jgi:tight adherence protein C
VNPSLYAGFLAAVSVWSLLAAMALRFDRPVMSRVGPRRKGAIAASAGVVAFAERIGSTAVVRRLARVDQLRPRISAAGWNVNAETVGGIKALTVLAGFVIGGMAPSPLHLMGPVLVLAGIVGADFVSSRAAKMRHLDADAEVPAFLDLLAAGSAAGLAAPAAVLRAARGIRGPLAMELRSASGAVELGGRWRDELLQVAERLQLSDLRRAVVAIARTETLGASLSETVRDLADDVRETRRARSAEEARKAPVKMLFPLVFMILPSFLLLTVVPVLLSTLRNIR